MNNSDRILNLLASNRTGLPCHQIALELALPFSGTQIMLDTLLSDGLTTCTSASYGLKGRKLFYHPSVKGLRYLQTLAAQEKAAEDYKEAGRTNRYIPAPRGKITSHLECFLTGQFLGR